MNGKICIELGKKNSSIYAIRWETGMTFSILEEIMHYGNIWYNRKRDYDTVIGLKMIAYNLKLASTIMIGESPKGDYEGSQLLKYETLYYLKIKQHIDN